MPGFNVSQQLGRLLLHDSTNNDVHPKEQRGGQDEKEHPARGPQTGLAEKVTEDHGTNETTKTAQDPDDATDHADIVGEVVWYVLVHRGFADPHKRPDDETQAGEDPDVGLEEDVCDAARQQLFLANRVSYFDDRLLPRR